MTTLKSRRSGKDLRDHPMLREVSNACIIQGCQALDLRAEIERLRDALRQIVDRGYGGWPQEIAETALRNEKPST